MFPEFGCHGRIVVGELPAEVVQQLEALPGKWLEYDAGTGAIEVRHVQPTSDPIVPTVVSELVYILAAVPYERHENLTGGELLIHTERGGRLVRITVDRGGALCVEWAHPDYSGAQKRPYDGQEIQIEPYEQRLNGQVTLRAANASEAAAALQRLADTFEGLYPEGDFAASANGDGAAVSVRMRDVNLDVQLLITELERYAEPRTLSGRIAVSSFQEVVPEHLLRFVLEEGQIWVQRPLLWA